MALAPISPEQLPPVSESDDGRRAQIIERAFWYGRDLRQTANNREACEKQGELVALIEANNAGPERE